MADKTWKKAERTIAQRYYESRRRGADTSSDNSGSISERIGKSDILYLGGSIEVKHSKKISYSLLWDAVTQAQGYKTNENEIAVAHVHEKGMLYGDTWTGLPIEDWDRLVSQPRFGVLSIRYTIILPTSRGYSRKSIDSSIDHLSGEKLEPGTIPVAFFQGGIPPVIVVQRLHQFYTWFLKDHTNLILL